MSLNARFYFFLRGALLSYERSGSQLRSKNRIHDFCDPASILFACKREVFYDALGDTVICVELPNLAIQLPNHGEFFHS
ncbi:MAG: hypothetical protein HS129_11375 [Leptospiraceae bacterium]|nr:hypothetical protein [Leptospiraceae bacterium]NUM42733.1 hypothetical protein [Leptospiraceae bacterium]